MDLDRSIRPPPPELELENLRAIKVLGKGAMGTVLLVHDYSKDPSARFPFALKMVEKSSLHQADRRARHEISVLNRLHNHPFLPSLLGSFESHDIICWAIPYCPGGDLNVLRYRQIDRVFSASVMRFYLAEIVCALEELHSKGIVYRDLKPENILIKQTGHVTLTDFDLSRNLAPRKSGVELNDFYSNPGGDIAEISSNLKPPRHKRSITRLFVPKKDKRIQNSNININININSNINNNNNRTGLKKAKSARVSPVSRRNPHDFLPNERSNSFVGTEEYVAPEVIRGDGHEFAVDWWALGVLCYEMLYGTTPFKGKNRKETFRKILLAQPEFMGKPNALTDLIGKLLIKDPTRRLGYRRGASEIKEHVFFHGLRWDLLTEVLRPPFLPSKEETELKAELLKSAGMNVREYFQKLKVPPSPLRSPSLDERRNNVSLTEF